MCRTSCKVHESFRFYRLGRSLGARRMVCLVTFKLYFPKVVGCVFSFEFGLFLARCVKRYFISFMLFLLFQFSLFLICQNFFGVLLFGLF